MVAWGPSLQASIQGMEIDRGVCFELEWTRFSHVGAQDKSKEIIRMMNGWFKWSASTAT